jgi:UDP-N-acetylglucosamine 2-epimerase (non-hydrolysing)
VHDDEDRLLRKLPARSVYLVLGTRPELIKLAGIARLFGDRAAVVHTGQHYTALLADGIARDLGFPAPSHRLEVGGRHRGEQIGEAVSALTRLFVEHTPRVVVVQGDTNAVVAGALAANAVGVPLVHIEAGLRSHDRAMPEEHNRVVSDHLADLCCAPTAVSAANLRAEGIADPRVTVTGNTVVDAVHALQPTPDESRDAADALGLTQPFVLATIHRPENVDDAARLAQIVGAIATIDATVVLPVHPRTAPALARLPLPRNLTVVEPFGYRQFLAVMSSAAVLLSDSGGVQEEASVLKRAVVVLRRSTERPEVLGTFAELTADPEEAATLTNAWIHDEDRRTGLAEIPSPYGDGHASERSVQAILRQIG